MKKIMMITMMSALALPALALETTTITTTSPESSITTTKTVTPDIQKQEEAPLAAPTTAPAVDALPQMGAGTLDQQRMEDPASSPDFNGPHRMDDPSIEDESGEYAPRINDVDELQDYE